VRHGARSDRQDAGFAAVASTGAGFLSLAFTLLNDSATHSQEAMTMNSISFASRPFAFVLSIAPLLLSAACAGAQPPVAIVPSTPTLRIGPRPAASSIATLSSVEPTSGTISISDEIRALCGIPTEDAFFAFDSAAIESTDIAPLDAVAQCFTKGPLAGRPMRLVGHADPRGPSEYNMALGQRRADSVEGYIDRRGVQRARIGTTSRGAIDATGHDEGGWAHDRRVDVQLGS
jgi:peptidoglycan-associated lipoprotein